MKTKLDNIFEKYNKGNKMSKEDIKEIAIDLWEEKGIRRGLIFGLVSFTVLPIGVLGAIIAGTSFGYWTKDKEKLF